MLIRLGSTRISHLKEYPKILFLGEMLETRDYTRIYKVDIVMLVLISVYIACVLKPLDHSYRP
jgi:hypothetical protein